MLGRLLRDLCEYADERDELAVHIVGTVLSNTDAVIPDFVYLRKSPRDFMDKPYIDEAPNLVVEIVLDETREVDHTVKRDLYERAGVAEYWIVDPDDATVKVLRRAGERLEPVAPMDPITSPLLPGFSLTLQRLFA